MNITWTLSTFSSDKTTEVQTENRPTVEFEEVEIYAPPGYNTSFVSGYHRWIPLDVVSEDHTKITEFANGVAASWWTAVGTDGTTQYKGRVVLMADGKRLHIGDMVRMDKESA